MPLPPLARAEREARTHELQDLKQEEAKLGVFIEASTQILEGAQGDLARAIEAGKDSRDLQETVAVAKIGQATHLVELDKVLEKIEIVGYELRAGKKITQPEPELEVKVDNESDAETTVGSNGDTDTESGIESHIESDTKSKDGDDTDVAAEFQVDSGTNPSSKSGSDVSSNATSRLESVKTEVRRESKLRIKLQIQHDARSAITSKLRVDSKPMAESAAKQ
jgi:hypothetical protein